MEKSKDAWAWVVVWPMPRSKINNVTIDLFFSTPDKLFEICPWMERDKEQLVKVQVPIDFEDWDYVPENY